VCVDSNDCLSLLALAYGSGYIVNFVDVMPAFSSVVFGIITAVATFGALMGNVIAGFIIKQPILQDWRKLFILFSFIYFLGGIAFQVLGSAKPRSWATFKAQQNQVEEETIPMKQADQAGSESIAPTSAKHTE
jgi:MFS family permease